MKTGAAVLQETNADWRVEEIEFDGPRPREVLVKTTAAGMCHSDEHARNGSMPVLLPIVGGHERAGVVIEVGEGVAELTADARSEIPHLLSLYTPGQLDLDSFVSATYSPEEANEGYRDPREGRNIRGGIVFD